MIGHYLSTLTPAQEDRVLTHPMMPGALWDDETGERCLRGVAEDWQDKASDPYPYFASWGTDQNFHSVALTYDDLCYRFGVERMNRVIRNRILANQARRELSRQREAVAI